MPFQSLFPLCQQYNSGGEQNVISLFFIHLFVGLKVGEFKSACEIPPLVNPFNHDQLRT